MSTAFQFGHSDPQAFCFDAESHVYRVGQEIVPSVTQVLALAGLSDVSGIPQHILDKAAQVGTAVHEATQYLDEGDLAEGPLDPLIDGYVKAYRKFVEDTKFTPTLIEHRCVHQGAPKFGMCVDRVGMLAGEEAILDIKTSSRPQPYWNIQLAAYAHGLGKLKAARAVVHLAKDGTYKLLIPGYQLTDDKVWLSALSVACWKLTHGAKLK